MNARSVVRLAALLAMSLSLPVAAASVKTARPTSAELALGWTDGMASTTSGRLFPAPRIVPLPAAQEQVAPVQVWSTVADAAGNVYLGTGPDGHILKIGASGEPTVLFSAPEPMVTALAIAPSGELLAGTAPGGAVYRVGMDGRGELWAATQERYVWTLAIGPGGEVYAGTGESGRILRIDARGDVDLVLDSDEAHIVSLLAGPARLVAGGAGGGLIYSIDTEGHAQVLHDGDLPEVTALALEPDGSVLAAMQAPMEPEVRRPAVRLRLPDGVPVGVTDESVGMLEERSGPTVRGVIEGLDPDPERPRERPRGRVVRIRPDGTVAELWSSTTEAPFSMVQDPRGRTLFGTGEPARLYRIEANGEIARLATFSEGQATGLVAAGRAWTLLATSNPARAYRVENGPAEVGLFLSPPIDAGGPARWGTIRWSVERPSGRTEVYTRTGNSRQPDDTWSGWSPAMFDSAGSTVVSPDGRFLQWRLRQLEGADPPPVFSDLMLRYEPFNRPPELDRFRIRADRDAFSGTVPLAWLVNDPDDDPVDVTLGFRPAGERGDWIQAALIPGTTAAQESGASKDATQEFDWDPTGLPEGAYEIRAVADDRSANAEDEGLEAPDRPTLRIIVDRTPPGLSFGGEGGRVVAEDAQSALSRVELVRDGRVRFTVRPVDGLCDSRRETFLVSIPEGSPDEWSIRVVDSAGNVGELPLAGVEGP